LFKWESADGSCYEGNLTDINDANQNIFTKVN
jgi:hypothetical protein